MDDEQVGLLLVFTPSSTEVCSTLKLPSRFRTSPIIAALVPWKLNVKQYRENEWQRAQDGLKSSDGRIEAKLAESIGKLPKAVTAKPQYARGLRIHQFTPAEYDFFKRAPRRYCIWNMPSDGTMKEPGFETKALVAVLNAWKAEEVGYKVDVRVVFVHVGALRSLQKLEALAMRRAKRPEMRFYTYGTHHSVHPERWGIKEIFPLGGVVTFTAKAILEDPFEVYRLIEQISQHPLWMCYVHPCAVAAVAKTSYPATDVLSLLNR
ncbi:hypothetical protein PHLGIDRAFT_474501 [Phlebiopsis gigantea 11061_1 CR5-6]|uniref:Uncharacterized protein n=1 Tax=Phlebiopsis gigantea (strain 11061_1 CR5-6) TaxID=745531 RepID=A0A0C3S5S2_PHLG1|nr:hypothetical protein PHLGIDRAFT_474501 [Phlebiopsis gigantea 11061_1 CR5-6]